jgi:hypothetical protein
MHSLTTLGIARSHDVVPTDENRGHTFVMSLRHP